MFRKDGSLALVDCGIESRWLIDAKIMDEDAVYCTPYYVSPERAAGEACTIQAEIYSLGIIFYELLTGQKPYYSGSTLNLIKKHALSPIPELPGEFKIYQPVLNKMLAKHPDDRYGSIDELLDDLYFAAPA
jgi:serine/threonine-protein kinase/serine/threonine-protein kinase PpkA